MQTSLWRLALAINLLTNQERFDGRNMARIQDWCRTLAWPAILAKAQGALAAIDQDGVEFTINHREVTLDCTLSVSAPDGGAVRVRVHADKKAMQLHLVEGGLSEDMRLTLDWLTNGNLWQQTAQTDAVKPSNQVVVTAAARLMALGLPENTINLFVSKWTVGGGQWLDLTAVRHLLVIMSLGQYLDSEGTNDLFRRALLKQWGAPVLWEITDQVEIQQCLAAIRDYRGDWSGYAVWARTILAPV